MDLPMLDRSDSDDLVSLFGCLQEVVPFFQNIPVREMIESHSEWVLSSDCVVINYIGRSPFAGM